MARPGPPQHDHQTIACSHHDHHPPVHQQGDPEAKHGAGQQFRALVELPPDEMSQRTETLSPGSSRASPPPRYTIARMFDPEARSAWSLRTPIPCVRGYLSFELFIDAATSEFGVEEREDGKTLLIALLLPDIHAQSAMNQLLVLARVARPPECPTLLGNILSAIRLENDRLSGENQNLRDAHGHKDRALDSHAGEIEVCPVCSGLTPRQAWPLIVTVAACLLGFGVLTLFRSV